MSTLKTIYDFDDLVDSRTLARHCLSLEPSSFFLHAIEIDEKSKCLVLLEKNSFPFFFFFLSKSFSFVEMTTKFNQDMYAKMRVKKNEPLSNLEEKGGTGH